MSDNDKDKIKEILEGHSRKFTLVEIVVGVVVVLLVGAGIGYAIFKVLTPSAPPVNEYSMQTTNQVVETPSPKQAQPVVASQSSKQSVAPQENLGNNSSMSNNTLTTPKETSSKSSQIYTNGAPSAGPKIISESSSNKQHNIEAAGNTKPKKLSGKRKRLVVNSQKVTHEMNNKIVGEMVRKKKSHRRKYIGSRKYLVWVSSNANRKLALLNVLKLRKCGHRAFSKEVKVKGKVYTRVYVGPITGYEAAKIESIEIKRQLKLNYNPIIERYDKVP